MATASMAIPIPMPCEQQQQLCTTPDSNSISRSIDLINISDLQQEDANFVVEPQTSSSRVKSVFPLVKLPGEMLTNYTTTKTGGIYLTNYRVVLIERRKKGVACIPIMSIDTVQTIRMRSNHILQITCKNGRIYRMAINETESSDHWVKILDEAMSMVRSMLPHLRTSFSRKFSTEYRRLAANGDISPPWLMDCPFLNGEVVLEREFERLGFDPMHWRITEVNRDFKLCGTYPRKLIAPQSLPDTHLTVAARARILYRFPTVVWYSKENGTVLIRSSQPWQTVFLLRNADDEHSLREMRIRHSDSTNEMATITHLMIVDCRHFTSACANWFGGGGFENPDNYEPAEVKFCGLLNIHYIRALFNALRECISRNAPLNSHACVNWLVNLASIMNTAQSVVHAMLEKKESVLVHCSDGWDRTSQVTTLSKIMADSYYRTMEGFELLVRRDWIEFGHKFADRTGATNMKYEQSPIFLQWLDCVHQLVHKFPASFEFTEQYLVKLALHIYSGLFSTFFYNSLQDKVAASREHNELDPFSVWSYLRANTKLLNSLYKPPRDEKLVLKINSSELRLWYEVYGVSSVEQVFSTPLDVEEQSSTFFGLITFATKKPSITKTIVRSQSSESLNLRSSKSNQPPTSSDHEFEKIDAINYLRLPYINLISELQDQVDVDGLTKIAELKEAQKIKNVEALCGELELCTTVDRSSSSRTRHQSCLMVNQNLCMVAVNSVDSDTSLEVAESDSTSTSFSEAGILHEFSGCTRTTSSVSHKCSLENLKKDVAKVTLQESSDTNTQAFIGRSDGQIVFG